MYVEIRSDRIERISKAAEEHIESGVPATMVFRHDGDYYSFSVNTGDEEPPIEESPTATP